MPVVARHAQRQAFALYSHNSFAPPPRSPSRAGGRGKRVVVVLSIHVGPPRAMRNDRHLRCTALRIAELRPTWVGGLERKADAHHALRARGQDDPWQHTHAHPRTRPLHSTHGQEARLTPPSAPHSNP